MKQLVPGLALRQSGAKTSPKGGKARMFRNTGLSGLLGVTLRFSLNLILGWMLLERVARRMALAQQQLHHQIAQVTRLLH